MRFAPPVLKLPQSRKTGEAQHIPLGAGARPHGVIVGSDDAPWVTDGGLNAIVRVDPETEAVEVFPLRPAMPI